MTNLEDCKEKFAGLPVDNPMALGACTVPAPEEITQLRAALAELLLAGALVLAAVEHKSVKWDSEKPEVGRLLKALEQGREALSL